MEKKDVLASSSLLDESLGEGVVVKIAATTTELVRMDGTHAIQYTR